MRWIAPNAVDQSVVIRIVDATDGTPEQAVEHNTAGMSLWYRRAGGLVVPITAVALAAANSAHSDGGIEHLDDGYYRVDLPDAACATGVDSVFVGGAVTGMVVIGAHLQLQAMPLVPTVAGRTLDVSTGGEAGVDWANVGSPTTTVGLSGTTVKADAISIDGSTVAAVNLKSSATVIYVGSVTGAATTTTLVDSGLTQVDDHWNGRVIIFLTGTLKYQATNISDFVAATDTLTFTAMTAAPTGGDTYVIL